MANFTSKVSIFYDYKGRGFSETLWSSSPAQVLRDNNVKAYLVKRLALADDDMKPVYARISDGNAPRRVLFLDLAQSGLKGALSGSGCLPDDAIDVRMTGASNTAAHMFLHAFPAKFIKEKDLTDLGDWSDSFTQFALYMTTVSNGWRLRYSTGNIPANRKFVTAVTPVSPRGYKFTVATANVFAIGDTLAMAGFPAGVAGYRGRKVVVNVNDTGLIVTVGGATPVGTVPDNVAYACKLSFPQEAIAFMAPVMATERKTGRVFGQPAGRRPNALPLRR